MCMWVFERKCSCSGNPGSEWLYGLWLQSIIRRSNWLQLLIAGPMLLSCKQRSPGIIIAYFQRGILQISSHWVPPLHASEPGYCSFGGLPCWRQRRSPWSFGLLSLADSFPAATWLRPYRQIYNVDKSLYTNNLQSFNTLLMHGAARERNPVRGVHIFPSAIKQIWFDWTSGAVIWPSSAGLVNLPGQQQITSHDIKGLNRRIQPPRQRSALERSQIGTSGSPIWGIPQSHYGLNCVFITFVCVCVWSFVPEAHKELIHYKLINLYIKVQ